jgi:hypothetical protein
MRAPTDKIDVAFLLREKEGDEFPWVFVADHVRLNYGDPLEPERLLPYQIDDISPTAIRFFLSAKDPGVYWVEPVIIVSAGVGKRKELVFTKKPIPVAFVDASTNGIGKANDFNELELLKQKDSKWVPWPPISESERRERIQYLQNPPPKFDFAPSRGKIHD